MSSNNSMTTKGHSAKAMSSSTSVGLQVAGSIRLYECENTRKRSMGFSSNSGALDLSEHDTWEEEDGSDECLHFGEKKRRLTMEQVKTLEKSFEQGNKLDLERKMLLAKALGLQPRQIAVWFQNRRARSKTKQLERDFDILNQEYRVLKSKYNILLEENDQFKTKVQRLNRKLEEIHDNSKAQGFNIESHQKPANSVLQPTNSPTELSVKMETPIKCSDPLRHIYPTRSKEGERYSIISEAASPVFNIHSTRTVESPASPVSLITAANNSSPIHLEGYAVREQVAGGGLKTHPPGHVWHCQPKVQVDQSRVNQAEDICCNLFCSLQPQGTMMLWE